MTYYRIKYRNNLWKDWLYFDRYFYKTKKDAEVVAKQYKKQVEPDMELRIEKTTVLNPIKSTKKAKVTVEKA